MMEYCKTCFNYKGDYDDHKQTFNDTESEKHFCIMYKNGIPEGIENDKSECPYHVPKGEL